jgi:hypothetical protein
MIKTASYGKNYFSKLIARANIVLVYKNSAKIDHDLILLK